MCQLEQYDGATLDDIFVIPSLNNTPPVHADSRPALVGGSPVRAHMPEWPILDEGLKETFAGLMRTGDWGRYHTEHSQRLVQRLKESYHAKHVLLTCSGTAAVEVALRAAGVEANDEVIMSAYDYKPNFTNIRHLQATPVLLDTQADNAQLDVDQLANAISSRTKAVIVSHLHGAMVNISQIDLPEQVIVIEDACQMPGAMLGDMAAGLSGDIGVISFGGSKTLSAGRGGAILTNNAQLAQRCKLQLDRGNLVYPLSEMQAALLLPQLDRFEERQALRRHNVGQLRELLSNYPCLTPFVADEKAEPDYYKFGMFYDCEQFGGLPRERFVEAMRAEGIPLGAGFRALHRIHHRKTYRMFGELPHAALAGETVVGLHHSLLLEPNAIEEFRTALDKLSAHVTMLQ